MGINNGVDVVGQSDLPGDATGHAFLWTKNHGMEDLGTLTGDFSSQALGINRDGEIVVESCDVNGNCRVALWQDVMTDLNSLAPPGSLYMVSPFAINDAGDVVGWGCIVSNGVCGSEQIPFLAVPCDNDGDGDERRDDGQATTAPSERTKVLLPDSLRRRPGRATGFFARLTTGFLKSER